MKIIILPGLPAAVQSNSCCLNNNLNDNCYRRNRRYHHHQRPGYLFIVGLLVVLLSFSSSSSFNLVLLATATPVHAPPPSPSDVAAITADASQQNLALSCLQEMTIAILICRLDTRGRRSVSDEVAPNYNSYNGASNVRLIRVTRDHLSDFRRDCCRNTTNGRPKLQCRPTRLCPERLFNTLSIAP